MTYRGYEICDTEAPFADLRYGWYAEEGEPCMGFGATVEDCMAGIDEELEGYPDLKRACVVDRVAEWQDKMLLDLRGVPRYTAWRSQVLNGIDWDARAEPFKQINLHVPNVEYPIRGWLKRGIDGLLPRKQPLKDFQRELIR